MKVAPIAEQAAPHESRTPGGTAEPRPSQRKMIYVLPGMGASQRMYVGPWRELTDCVFLDWPLRVEAVSITDIAARVIESAAISDGATLVGSSLGGIVACEIARLRKIERLFLVGSARKKEEVSSVLRILHPLIDLAPLSFVQRACGKLPSELCSMFSESDAAFVRSMCRAIFSWDGLLPGTTNVYRIHGKHDFVIPPPNDGEALLDGGHLIAMTHAAECVRFLRANNQSQQPTSGSARG